MYTSHPVLNQQQHEAIHRCLTWFSKEIDVRCVLLADLSGQDIAMWSARNDLDTPSIAALAAGDIVATLELSRMVGGQRSCNLVVQEHDEHTIMMARVGQGMFLFCVVGREVPIGWTRLALRRASEQLTDITGAAAMATPPAAFGDDFADRFAAQLNTLL